MRGTRLGMIAVLVAVVGVSLPATAQDGEFVDVPPDHTFHDEIAWLAQQGITEGCDAAGTMFCPGLAVTRGQMAAFLARGLQLDETPTTQFADVPSGHTFWSEIGQLASSGITQGCDAAGTLFCPDDVVTRQQMAAFLSRALFLRDDGGGNTFIDDDGSTFEEEIAMLAHAGVTQGCDASGTRFCPLDTVTRGQMAAFLGRGIPLIYWGEVTTTSDSGTLVSSNHTYDWAWEWEPGQFCNGIALDEPLMFPLGCREISDSIRTALCVSAGGSAVFAGEQDAVAFELVPAATTEVRIEYSDLPMVTIRLDGAPAFLRAELDAPGLLDRDYLIEAYGETGNLLGSNHWDADSAVRTRTCNVLLPAA